MRPIGTLNADKSQRDPDLPRADRRSARGQPAPDHRQARLVEPDGRPRPADRHRPLLRDLRQCAGRLHGLDRPGQPGADDGQPWAMRFPVITIRDMVRAQVALLDALGIEQLHAVVGGSMGGMQALSALPPTGRTVPAPCW